MDITDNQQQYSPEVLQVEVTTRCNLDCSFCKARPDDVKQRGDLDFGVYEKVITQLAGRITRVNLWGAGEPMLHPRFFQMARLAADLGVKRIKVSTNGHFLSISNIEKIIASDITQIRIAVDNEDPEIYAKNRRGGDYDRVIHGIRDLCAVKNKMGSPLRVVVCAVSTDRVRSENEPVKRLAQALNADAFEIMYDIWDEEGIHTGLFPPDRCAYPFKYFTLLANGLVAPCCHVWHPDWILGRAFEQSVDEIWEGPCARRLRTVFKAGNFEFCPRCNYFGATDLRKVEKTSKDF